MQPYKDLYSKSMLNAFFAYWTEADLKAGKIRKDSEKYFDMSRRLVTWKSREDKTTAPLVQQKSQLYPTYEYDANGRRLEKQ